MLYSRQVDVGVCPVPAQFHLLLLVQPVELRRGWLQEVLECVQVGYAVEDIIILSHCSHKPVLAQLLSTNLQQILVIWVMTLAPFSNNFTLMSYWDMFSLVLNA